MFRCADVLAIDFFEKLMKLTCSQKPRIAMFQNGCNDSKRAYNHNMTISTLAMAAKPLRFRERISLKVEELIDWYAFDFFIQDRENTLRFNFRRCNTKKPGMKNIPAFLGRQKPATDTIRIHRARSSARKRCKLWISPRFQGYLSRADTSQRIAPQAKHEVQTVQTVRYIITLAILHSDWIRPASVDRSPRVIKYFG